jgi:uracil-DNA glycosylase family 4
MGLLFADTGNVEFRAKAETALLHQLGCRACPLALQPGRMEPTGAIHPLIYIVGEAPGKNEIEQKQQFIGKSGQLLREHIPQKYLPQIRWNNVVRSRPEGNATPGREAIEACRPSVELDIAQSRPKVIFGFGNVPLAWVSGFNGVTFWRGRRMPVKIRDHACWYYAFLHPAYLLRERRGTRGEVISEDERMTALDLRRAFNQLKDLPPPVVHSAEQARANVFQVQTLDAIRNALQWAAKQPAVGVDYETNCLRPYEGGAKILTAAFGTPDRAYAFPVRHPGAPWTERELRELEELWQRFLLHGSCSKIVHNLAFEQEWSAYFYGPEVLRARPWQDTATAAAIVDERRGKTKPGCFSLEFLVQQYFGFNLKQLSNVDRAKLATTSLEAVLPYNGMDAKYHIALWDKLWAEIKQEGLEQAYKLAVRRVPTVVLSQLKGVPVDQKRVTALYRKYSGKVEAAEAKIAELQVVREFSRLKGRPFNPYSGPDLLFILGDMLKRPEIYVVDKYTKKEKRSADESVLEQIDHPLANAILTLRGAAHNANTYISPMRQEAEGSVIWPDGLIHAQFNTFFSEGFRFSAESPNLQNYPKRNAESKEVRQPVCAPPGCLVLSADYGQIEARVAAMYTRDKRFCQALWERYDIHQDWAERLAADYPERVGGRKNLKDKKAMKDFRTDIKNQWTFPLIYGARAESVAGYLHIPLHIVKRHCRQFWLEFGGIRKWQEEQLTFYREYGYVESLTGRRRHGPLSVNQVYNTPVQGLAAEIFADAMARLSETNDPRLQPELNIHDDLTWLRVAEEELEVIAEAVVDKMLNVPFKWAQVVPISVELSVGPDWMRLEEAGTYSSDTWKR